MSNIFIKLKDYFILWKTKNKNRNLRTISK